jgi:hypothetical protein
MTESYLCIDRSTHFSFDISGSSTYVPGLENQAFLANWKGPVGTQSVRFPTNGVTTSNAHISSLGAEFGGAVNASFNSTLPASLTWASTERLNQGFTACALVWLIDGNSAAARAITVNESANQVLCDAPQRSDSGGVFYAGAWTNWGTNQLTAASKRNYVLLGWRVMRDSNEGQRALFYEGRLAAKVSITRPADGTSITQGDLALGSVFQNTTFGHVMAAWIWRGRALTDPEMARFAMDPWQIYTGQGFGSEGRFSSGNPRWGDMNFCL